MDLERPADGTAGADGEPEPMPGTFGSSGGPGAWRLTWFPGAGDVVAEAVTGAAAPAQRLLGRLPAARYLALTVAAVDEARGSTAWREGAGVELLLEWISRVRAALDGELGQMADESRTTPYYLDLGHSRQLLGDLTDHLLAPELWNELDENVTRARGAADSLALLLAGDANLAQATRRAQELVELALSVHVALADGYRAAHERFPTGV
ncbi:MAG: hypothetical protein ACKVWR_02895 [Acidimicrobiales bacterium]